MADRFDKSIRFVPAYLSFDAATFHIQKKAGGAFNRCTGSPEIRPGTFTHTKLSFFLVFADPDFDLEDLCQRQ